MHIRNKSAGLTLLSVIFFLLLQSGVSSAYTLIECEPKWSEYAIPVAWKLNDDCSADVSFSSCYSAMQDSFDAWSDVSCSYMDWDYQGTTGMGADDWAKADGTNLMVWEEGRWPSDLNGAIAVAAPIYYGCNPGVFSDTDIMFNGVDFVWGVGGEWTKMDIANVATHEIGHACGLDHSEYQDATMYYATSQGVTSSRSLHQDDINGLCTIYEGQMSVEVGSPCGGACDSAEGFYCAEADGDRICTTNCRDDGDCPSGYACYDIPGSGNSCWPSGTLGIGRPCASERNCKANMVCESVDGSPICTYRCPYECPERYECGEADSGMEVCVFEATAGFGESCENSRCDGGLRCESIGGEQICTHTCRNDDDCDGGWVCDNGEYCTPDPEAPATRIASFSAFPETQVLLGGLVTFSATATSPNRALFQYWLQAPAEGWELLRDYDANGSYAWRPETAGSYIIRVRVKDSSSSAPFEDSMELEYLVTASPGDGDIPMPDGDTPVPDGDSLFVDGDLVPYFPDDYDYDDDDEEDDHAQSEGGGGCGQSPMEPAVLWLFGLLSFAALRRIRAI